MAKSKKAQRRSLQTYHRLVVPTVHRFGVARALKQIGEVFIGGIDTEDDSLFNIGVSTQSSDEEIGQVVNKVVNEPPWIPPMFQTPLRLTDEERALFVEEAEPPIKRFIGTDEEFEIALEKTIPTSTAKGSPRNLDTPKITSQQFEQAHRGKFERWDYPTDCQTPEQRKTYRRKQRRLQDARTA